MDGQVYYCKNNNNKGYLTLKKRLLMFKLKSMFKNFIVYVINNKAKD